MIEAELKERGQARREYDEAVAQGRRASIAEEERPDVFTMRVGNILPGSVRYYRVRSGKVRRLPLVRRFSCPPRSRLIGRLVRPDGFWLCLGPPS